MKGWLPLYRIMTRMNKRMNEWMNECMNEWMPPYRRYLPVMNEDEWSVNRWINEWIGG